MKNLSDNELEKLIADSFKRQEICQHIEKQTMAEVKRSTRKLWLHKWERIAAFSLGWPLLIFIFLCGIRKMIMMNMPQYVLVGFAVSTLIFLIVVWHFINHFSVHEVS